MLVIGKNPADLYTAWRSIRIRSFPGPCFPAFWLNAERYFVIFSPNEENTDQKNSEDGDFLRSDIRLLLLKKYFKMNFPLLYSVFSL